ncbi:PAAR motif protein [compost metagenome]|uniref:PAAR domain-containing protein n=1 Tax=Cupriavidus sp. SIMBA_020 TaxID=3085766 RepID=UPI000F9B0976
MAGQKGIVRRGDTTTHGGKVLEGEPTFVFYGEPAAGVGHMVWCPQCKGSFPIIEGDPTFQAMGRAMALDGMLTACGARLISSIGAQATVRHPVSGTSADPAPDEEDRFDDRYVLRDSATGEPLPNTEYAAVRAGAEPEFGTTDESGRTHLLAAQQRADNVTIYVEG